MFEELLENETNIKYIQKYVPYDKPELKEYWLSIGFECFNDTARYYDEMPTVKCFKLMRTIGSEIDPLELFYSLSNKHTETDKIPTNGTLDDSYC